MTIIGSAKLKNCNIENVGKLYEKHQQNPNNNGVKIIDKVISLSNEKNSECIGNLLSIRNYGQDRTFQVVIKHVGTVALGQDTGLFDSEDKIVRIKDGTLKTPIKVKCFINNEVEYFPVLRIDEYQKMFDHYQLRISNRNNYVLENGLVIAAD